MAGLHRRRNRKKLKRPAGNRHSPGMRAMGETEFKGPNIKKRHRKPDEIYGDTSIPDGARKE